MKLIYTLLLLFASGVYSSTYAQSDGELIRQLKLADARQAGVEQDVFFKLEYNRSKENMLEKAIESTYEIPLGTKVENVLVDQKSTLIRQLFIPVGQRVSGREEQRLANYVDSLFNDFLKHPSEREFITLIEKYSKDKRTYWLTDLEETKEFHVVLNALKLGEISRPFSTPRGIHIVQKIKESDQAYISSKVDFPSINPYLEHYNIKVNTAAKNKLHQTLSTPEPLVTSDYIKLTTEDYHRFALGNSSKGDALVWVDFLKYALIKDLKARTSADTHFSNDLKNRYDELLLSHIYDIRVKAMANVDDQNLEDFFQSNKANYHWDKQRFNGLLVFAKNKKVLKALQKEFEEAPLSQWEKIIAAFNAKEPLISYEMGTFEEGENGSIDAYAFGIGKKKNFKRKGFSKVRIYGEKISGPITLTKEIKPRVESDYLKFIELNWEKELRSKYKEGKLSPIFLNSVNNPSSN